MTSNDETRVIPFSTTGEAAELRLEWSAEELHALAQPRPMRSTPPARALVTDSADAGRTTRGSDAVAEGRAAHAKALSTHDLSRWLGHAPLALGLSMAVVLAGTALVHRTPQEVPAPVTTVSVPTHTTQSAPAPKPVLFVNPFDETEVFEFPPGTTEADARDSVASLLLARARERQKNAVNLTRRNRRNS